MAKIGSKWKICKHGRRPSFCKPCIQEYDKNRANLPHRVKAREEYRKTEAFKASVRASGKKYRAKNPDKRNAHLTLASAVRHNAILKQPCEICGEIKVHAHHDDYSKPLAVRWLCRQHHLEQHDRENPI